CSTTSAAATLAGNRRRNSGSSLATASAHRSAHGIKTARSKGRRVTHSWNGTEPARLAAKRIPNARVVRRQALSGKNAHCTQAGHPGAEHDDRNFFAGVSHELLQWHATWRAAQ